MNETEERERREEIMQRWDRWRSAIENGDKGSWPRDEFECLLDELTTHDEATERERFEKWISAKPHRLGIEGRFYDDGIWPGVYIDRRTQIAWEAWQQALEDK